MFIGRLQAYSAASYRWLRSRQAADGSWLAGPALDVCAYYKAPWSFHAAGDTEAALRSLGNIERHLAHPNGDLAPIGNPVLIDRHPLYCHGHVAIGAARAGRSDFADGLLDFMLPHRHPELGAWGDRLDTPEPRRFDSISTACVGLAMLERGRLEEAAAAVDFLARLLERQPDPARVFLSTVYANGDLLAPGSGSGSGADRQVRISGRFQVWWAISFPLIFLARHAEVTGEPRSLRAALAYLALLDRCRQAWDDMSAGKAALGCATLYRLTGEPGFRARAFKAVRAIVSRLAADGGIRTQPSGEAGSARSPTIFAYEVNAEFASILASVGQAVAQRDGSPLLLPVAVPADEPLGGWACHAERLLLHQARIRSYQWHKTRLARWMRARTSNDRD